MKGEDYYLQQWSIVLQKNELKRLVFLSKICNKFVVMNNRRDAGNVFVI